jgi:hypothetical protein
MSIAPEDLAASRFRPIRQARDRIAKSEAAHAESVARLERLRAELGPAERRDREARGQALVDGKSEPASVAAKLKAPLEQEERRQRPSPSQSKPHAGRSERSFALTGPPGDVRRCGNWRGSRVATRTRSPSSRLRGMDSPVKQR